MADDFDLFDSFDFGNFFGILWVFVVCFVHYIREKPYSSLFDG